MERSRAVGARIYETWWLVDAPLDSVRAALKISNAGLETMASGQGLIVVAWFDKADRTFLLHLRRLHELADRVKDDGKFMVVLFFDLLEKAREVLVSYHGLPHLHESPHDRNIDIGRAIAVQNAGEHGHALLGEGIGQIFATLSAARF